MVISYFDNLFLSYNFSADISHFLSCLVILCLIIVASWIVKLICKGILVKFIHSLVSYTTNKWDDILINNGVINRIVMLVPAVLVYFLVDSMFSGESESLLIHYIQLICILYLITACVMIVNSILNSVSEIYETFEVANHTPIKSFIQMLKVLILLVAFIGIISLLINKSPWTLLKALGALTAVTMLIFKDAIVGFVAGIQLSAQKMVRIGDWITMSQYGADGDVTDISLTTVKVQNFDKTIVSVPTSALVEGSFQNWRGMSDSGGRRIKRSINLDMNSFKFLNNEDIKKLMEFEYLNEYLERKTQEIEEHNKTLGVNAEKLPINGRRLTNVGTFRHYINEYLRSNSKIHKNLTFIVRQLQPTEKGLPLQIYVFTNDINWVNYEGIQSDIFDHLLTAIPEFGLSVYQDPTGRDFRKFIHS